MKTTTTLILVFMTTLTLPVSAEFVSKGIACIPDCGDPSTDSKSSSQAGSGQTFHQAMELARKGEYLVLAMDADPANVAKAREAAAAAGLLGRALYVEQGTADRIPVVDHFVDLLVLGHRTEKDLTEALAKEIDRVLTPIRGQAVLADKTIRKPEPEGSDWWTHSLHGADNNQVSTDTAFHTYAMLQYIALPWQTSFTGTMLVDRGLRIEGTDWVIKRPNRHAIAGRLRARNAYNGQVLWERELPQDIEPDTPVFAMADGRLYMADGKACRALVVDIKTGEDLPPIVPANDPDLRVKWLAVENGRLYMLIGPARPTREPYGFIGGKSIAALRANQAEAGKTLVCWDVLNNKPRWRHEEPAFVDYRTVAVRDGKTYFYSEQTRLGCLDENGRLAWENTDPSWMKELKRGGRINGNTEGDSTLKAGPGFVRLSIAFSNVGMMFSAEDGRYLWKNKSGQQDYFVGDRFYTQGGAVDPLTGNVVEKGHFNIGGWCGIRTWVPELKSGLGHVVYGLRSPCGVGAFAAGGLVHIMSSQCDCWPSTRGAGAVAGAADLLKQIQTSPEHPLVKGEAYDRVQSSVFSVQQNDWRQYRGDARRTGSAGVSAGAAARRRWTSAAEHPFAVPEGYERHRMTWLERPAPPVIGGGMAFIAGSDGSVRAVALADGKTAWTAWTGGAILTSPVFAHGRVYAGSADGWVYAFDARNGALAWKWRGAPAARDFMVYGKLMSRWPVTAVLEHGGVLYGVAGQWMQNGCVAFALDAATGETRWRHWTDPDNNHFLDNYLAREDPAYAPCGQLAIAGNNLWIRDYGGIPAIFETATGRRVPHTPELIAFQKTYWNFGMWFATSGRDILVVDDRLVLQGGSPLLVNPDIREDKHGARFVALRADEDGRIQALPHPPTAIHHSFIAPALDGDDLLMVGGQNSRVQPYPTMGISLWNLDTWKAQFDEVVKPNVGQVDPAKPYNTRPPQRLSLDISKARWQLPDVDVNAIALCADAAVVAEGLLKPIDKKQRGVHPGYAGWALTAYDRATGAKRWSVALPGEPVYNGLAAAADGSWIVALRDGALVAIGD